MKRAIFKIIASLVVFILSICISGYIMNKGNVNTTKSMEKAYLPVIYMNVGGEEVNKLNGFTQSMEPALLRDSITPLDENRGVSFRVVKFNSLVKKVQVKLRTVEGERLIENIEPGNLEEDDFSIRGSVNFKGLIDSYTEYCVEIVLTLSGGKEVFYYTRVIDAPMYCAKEKLNFVLDFHEKEKSLETNEELKEYMESNYTGDNTTFAKVNIHSSMSQLSFGNLNVKEITKPYATIKELASETAVISVNYLASVLESSLERKYFVTEYYRIKYTKDVTYLLDYERYMTQIFNDKALELTENTLTLGIRDTDVDLKESDDGSHFAFVSSNKLYEVNVLDNEISSLFSFYDEDNFDDRTYTDRHRIKILSVDELGNVWFLVYGYINRGTYEGRVGFTLYEYNGVNNLIEEKMFISSNKAPEMLISDIDELSYLNKAGTFFFMLDRSIYSVDTNTGDITEMVNDLEENMYTISASKSVMVWQNGNDVNSSGKLMVMNLNTAQITTISPGEDKYVKPLGFMNEDLIYGIAYKEDVVTDKAGRVTFPMTTIKIQNEYGELQKTYENDGIYVTDAYIDENLLTMERAVKNDKDPLKYDSYDNDYITNNVIENVTQNIVETTVDDKYETIVRIRFAHDLKGKTVLLTPQHLIYEGSKESYLESRESTKNHYYVYYGGKLQDICTKESKAVGLANDNYGVVVNDRGRYVWYRANRELRNQIMTLTYDKIETDETGLVYCLNKILEYEGSVRNTEYLLNRGETILSIMEDALENKDVLDLTGCSLDSILYYVNRDIPVLVLLDSGDAMLIVGYNQLSVVVTDPKKGTYKIGMNEAEELFTENGNQFITYVPND